MNISLRTAIISALTVGGAFAALDANAQIPLPSTGNSNLLFFVTDVTTGTTYTEELTQTVTGTNGVFTSAAATSGGTVGTLNTYTGDSNFTYNAGANSNLQSFITSAKNANNVLNYGIDAGVLATAHVNMSGNNLAVLTATDYTAASGSAAASDPSIVNSFTSNLTSALGTTGLTHDINQINLGGLDSFGGTSNGIIGTPASASANLSFYSLGATQLGATIGSTVQLFGLTGGGSQSSNSLAYDLGTLSFNGTTLSFTANTSGTTTTTPPAVPLPAAVWLLGSGLLGLAGVSRRRRTTNMLGA